MEYDTSSRNKAVDTIRESRWKAAGRRHGCPFKSVPKHSSPCRTTMGMLPEWAGHIYYTGKLVEACMYHTITDLYTHEGTSLH